MFCGFFYFSTIFTLWFLYILTGSFSLSFSLSIIVDVDFIQPSAHELYYNFLLIFSKFILISWLSNHFFFASHTYHIIKSQAKYLLMRLTLKLYDNVFYTVLDESLKADFMLSKVEINPAIQTKLVWWRFYYHINMDMAIKKISTS